MMCTLASFAQRKIGLMEYTTNSTVRLEVVGKNTHNGTGLLFVFETAGGRVPSLITARHLLDDAQTISFYFLEADANNAVQYNKPQQITIAKSDLKIINHPDKDVDLVMIPIVSILSYFSKKNITISYHPLTENTIPNDSVLNRFTTVEDVLMVGHPAALHKTLNHVALVKQGTTATPAFLDVTGKKELLINIATYDGASGAPVFAYQRNNIDRFDLRMDGQRMLLLGINTATYTKGYQEKVYPENNMATEDVGVVIKSTRILDFKKEIERTVRK